MVKNIKKNERTRQHLKRVNQKYGNRTKKNLKENVSKDFESLYLQDAYNFANSYEKIYDDVKTLLLKKN